LRGIFPFSFFGKPVPKKETAKELPQLIRSLQSYSLKTKLARAALETIAQNLNESEIRGLRRVFMGMDHDHTGLVSVDDFAQALGSFNDQTQQKQKRKQKQKQKRGDDEGGGGGGCSAAAEAELQGLLARLDVHGTGGKLEYTAFLAATIERSQFLRESNLKCAFDHLTHHKACLDLPTLVEIIGSRKQARELMDRVDKNRNGRISYGEFVAMMMQEEAEAAGVDADAGGAEEEWVLIEGPRRLSSPGRDYVLKHSSSSGGGHSSGHSSGGGHSSGYSRGGGHSSGHSSGGGHSSGHSSGGGHSSGQSSGDGGGHSTPCAAASAPPASTPTAPSPSESTATLTSAPASPNPPDPPKVNPAAVGVGLPDADAGEGRCGRVRLFGC
jgi:Ca2+-binding EF-hand superfamily protein